MGEYKDRSIATIQHDVEKQFKEIEKKNGRWIRDDLEIAQAGIKICWAYIHAIKSDKSMNYGTWALGPLRKLQKQLQDEIDTTMTGRKLFTNNKDQIYNIANRIDNAEKEVLKMLWLNNTNRDSRELVKKSEKEHNGKNIFIMEGGSNLKKQTGNLIFTKESNPVKIHDALKGLFENPNQVYQIDYFKCTNPKIKAIMSKLAGNKTCYLRYDAKQKTYTIRNQNGDGISNRAYIWEGVRLTPDGVKQWRAYAEDNKKKEQLSNTSIDKNNLLKELKKAMPSTEKLSANDRETLVIETDKRLLDLLVKARRRWYELHNEPISKLHFATGLMELHLISGSTERDEIIWEDENKNKLGNAIYDFLDGNEGEYKKYLTQRVHALRQKLDPLTKITKINVEGPVNNKEKLDKWNILYWIEIFKTTIDKFRESEGDSRLDDDDKYLTKMKQILQNAEASIKDAENLSKDTIVKNIINPLWNEWAKFKNIVKTISGGSWMVRENPVYYTHYNYLKNIFFGKKVEQINSLRQLWNLNRVFDKTETSHLGDEIAKHADQIDIRANNQDINKCLDTIKSKLSAKIDNNGNYTNTKFLDGAYSAAANGRDSLMSWLAQNKMIPTSWINTSLDKDTLKSFDDLCAKLNQQKKLAENPPETLQSLKEKQHAEKIKLEQKGSKSEDDRKRLQALDFLEKHPEEQKRINQATLDSLKKELKYGGLVELTNPCLLKPFVENWWGAKGKNANVYNDIIGYGLWDLSDENAKIAGEIMVEIAITVAIAVATGGMWGAIVAGMLRGLATGARAARWVRLANTIRKIVTIWQRSYKALNWTGRATKLWLQASGLLLEGTAFNAASTMVHAAMQGTSLDNLNLNPTSTENIKTAAFLGALSVSNQLAHTVWKAWASTRIGINLQKGLEAAKIAQPAARWGQVASELWAMLAAEQAINFSFGHDVIDPKTWEVKTERSLLAPTQQDLIQMIGMILAFKMVKPALWHRIEQKMNNGTLEICRSVNPKEVLVRDKVSQKVVPLQKYIDSQYNNYKKTPEQYKLRNHNQWREKQSKHELEILKAQEVISKNLNLLNSPAMTTLGKAKDIVNLSSNDIKRIQREIWLKWKEVDGVFGPKSSEALSRYLETRKVTPETQTKSKEQDLFDQFSDKIFSKEGVKIWNDTYQYVFEQNMTANANRKGRIKLIKNGQTIRSVESDINKLPDNANGTGFKEHFNQLREQYINENMKVKQNNSSKENFNTPETSENNLNQQINTLQKEITQLKGSTSLSHNDYFTHNKHNLVGKKFWIDWVKYEASHLNKDWSLQIKQVDWNQNFSISSFKQLYDKGQVNWFSDTGPGSLKSFERNNHDFLQKLFNWEKQFLKDNARNKELLNQKESELTELKQNVNEIDIKRDSSDPFKEAKESMTPEQKENRDKSSKTIDLNFQKAEKWETNWEIIKLDWVTKTRWNSVLFMEVTRNAISRRSKQNLKIDKSFVLKLKEKLGEIKTQFKDLLSKFWEQWQYLNKKIDDFLKKEDLPNNEEKKEPLQKENPSSNKEGIDFQQDLLVKQYFEIYWKPEHKIEIGNGVILETTNVIEQGSRKYLIWYVKKGSDLHLRLFYRSNSEGVWRSCPWNRLDSMFSKWEEILNSSYETTTRVDPRIGKQFDNLPVTTYEGGINPISGHSGVEPYERYQSFTPLRKEMISEVNVKKLSRYDNAVEFYMGKESSDVILAYNSLEIPWLDYKAMSPKSWANYSYQHDFLWNVEVEVYSMQYNGKPVDIHFARSEQSPDKVWIENIVYSDAKLNSFGIYDKQINAGPLTAKPIDYESQVPFDMRWNPHLWGHYIDIRDLYQGNPIIKQYKQLKNIQS